MSEPHEGLLARLGSAIVAPQRALAVAGDRRNAGRSGGDLLVVLAVVLVATELRGLAGAVWIATSVDLGFGARAVVDVVTRALTIDLVFLVLGAIALWLAGGARNQLGRAFDLACVAVLPLVAVGLVATVIARAFELHVPPWLGNAIAGAGYAWAGMTFARAIAVVRGPRAGDVAASPYARHAGRVLAAVAAIGVGVQVSWIVHHDDLVRPMVRGDRAPALALPAIGAGGALGSTVTLPAGKPVVLDFWATWCGPCLRALPRVDAFARAHPEVAVIAVNVDDPAEARAIFEAGHFVATLVADDGTTAVRYGVMSYPHVVVVDRAGIVRVVARGGEIDLTAAVADLR